MPRIPEWNADCMRINLITLHINDVTAMMEVSKGPDLCT